jgi:translation initiation factor 4G
MIATPKWKPKWRIRAEVCEREAAQLSPDDAVLKKVRWILNILSTETLTPLSERFVGLIVGIGMRSDLLSDVVDMVVAKAQDQPHLSAVYAELCLKLSLAPRLHVGEHLNGKKISDFFIQLVLQKCEEDFEEPKVVQTAREGWSTVLSRKDLDKNERWARRCGRGHIRFQGELFKKGLLSEDTLHESLQHLLWDRLPLVLC